MLSNLDNVEFELDLIYPEGVTDEHKTAEFLGSDHRKPYRDLRYNLKY